MKLHILTIVLDGMPWLPSHLAVFNTLNVDWHWHIVEGVAANTHCTKWCRTLLPRLSVDGTTEFLDDISAHKRVTIYRKEQWDGKIEMVNAPLKVIQEPGLLWEMDADELWTKAQIETGVNLFIANPNRQLAQFKCRYYFGPDIVITSDNTYGNHHDYEWYRLWRWTPGQLFTTHEPPRLPGSTEHKIPIADTEKAGLVFEHYAYATPEAVSFKEYYYGYTNALENWHKLQENKKWPARLGEFIPWIKDEATASRL